jgi:hypothetical protein
MFLGLGLEEHEKGNDQKDTQEQLNKKLQNTIATMMDERSMLSQIILNLAEKSVARTSHEWGHSSEEYGGGVLNLSEEVMELDQVVRHAPSRRPSLFQINPGNIALLLDDGTRRGTIESTNT